ncbi:mRNA biogenesis factor-domain-containing protein [Ganoderma leucocontextum]|nr:mRNA biogenesis factor-domain-containing protein [Ganoderma leucocontextum]
MAKGKSANPMDAYRKAQRKKELKKNKTERAKTRDFALVKKDTRDLEEEVAKLESASDSSASDKARLAELKSELEKIVKKKEEYVQEHPEQRKLVFKSRRPNEPREETKDESTAPRKRNLFKKNGLPRHPERSIYYDPVMNPFGVPPPGMPYVERALLPHEVDSDAEPQSDDDDDIAMPEGPPPDEEESEDSDDDIPMPEGPPPPRPGDPQIPSASHPPLPMGPPPFISPPLPSGLPVPSLPPPPSGIPPLSAGLPIVPPPPPGMPPLPPGSVMFSPPPPPGFHVMTSPPPPPPPGFPMMSGFLPGVPPPPPSFPPFPPTHLRPPIPAPPPGFYPRKGNAGVIQDPLSSIPHQTFQAHRVARATGHQKATSGGVRLSIAGSPPAAAPAASAVISAEPELRDFKKESTAFVPATLKRKRGGGAGSKVNAAPTIGPTEENDGEGEPAPVARPDLLSTLQDKFGAPRKKEKVETEAKKTPVAKRKDDYEKFLEEMGDVLGPPTAAK